MAELSKAIARLMEDRAQAPVPEGQHRRLYERIRAQVPPAERAAAEAFARQLLGRGMAEHAERLGVEAAAGMCAGAYRFLAAPGDEPRVRVFNPELARDGWDAPVTVVETALDDRPFIVDTVREVLHQAGAVVRVFVHPVVGVERDRRRAVVSISAPETALPRESFLHAELDRIADPAASAALAAALEERLGDVILATNDYRAMRRAASALAQELRTAPRRELYRPPPEEIAAFLEWLEGGNFVFLGYREYRFAGEGRDQRVAVDQRSGLGLLRKERSRYAARPRVAELPPRERRRVLEGPPLAITKTSAESPIHRRARMDHVGVRSYDPLGRVRGERRFLGLFTSRAYAEEAAKVPVLRLKLDEILAAEGAIEGSHDYKSIVAIFNSIPKEPLFTIGAGDLRQDIRVILAAEGTDDVRVTVRSDQLDRGIAVMVVLSRDRFSADLRRKIEAAVARGTGAEVLDRRTVLIDESDQARLHFYLAAPPAETPAASPDDLRNAIRELLRTWDDRLRDALDRAGGFPQPGPVAQRYAAIFSPEYKAGAEVDRAVRDIRCLDRLLATRQPQVDLLNAEGSSFTTLTLYLLNEELVLSDFLPVLENLGLRVFAENPLALAVPASETARLHVFEVQRSAGGPLDIGRTGGPLAEALLAHRRGRLPNDALNTLVVAAGLSWRQVQVLRTYAAHAAQAGVASRPACIGALARHPGTAAPLWEYFLAKFDPADPRPPRERLAGPLAEIETRAMASLDAVETVADDRILRAVLATLAATQRTNYFGAPEDSPLAIKLDAARVSHLPRPRPAHEIFVCGTQVEGVHLRAGDVARGGIRLSDRPDDYRTEILGLMQTQTAKNAVIVPTGAKGGFIVPRQAGAPPAASQATAAFRAFIGSLLGLTDNVVQGRVTPPEGVIYDEADPYLVVAADKGTGAFSDIANAVAAERGFWLGDAFASGGSQGYDHKKAGITARGAWECVRRHFHERGVDIDRQPINVVGIGDMSGDVFGNFMILSSRLRLRAAFNHNHVFLDPDPDPEAAFGERRRLFALPRSGWNDYDAGRISAGGGVFARNAKAITLSPQACKMLGVEAETLTGEELVRAVLRMEADLLWNGGIGTYIKASFESHAEVGDSANDAVRVDARDLRAKVIAEGGNLGCTQHGRVEFALAGGAINTDAIDNAGGVNLSDHEVNLKIALGPLVESGELSMKERDLRLAELTDEVTALVLRTNRRQALALSVEQARSQTRLSAFVDLSLTLESEGVLDRALGRLPDRETLRRRRSAFLGLTRPELAVILAHAKLHLQHRLLASDLPDDPYLERLLFGYFPRPVIERHRAAVRAHRLRREIIAVRTANGLIDVAGAAFVNRIQRDTGCDAVAVVRAWAVAAAVGDVEELYDRVLDAAVPLAPAVEIATMGVIEEAMEHACKRLIENHRGAGAVGELIKRFLGPVCELGALLPELLPEEARGRLDAAERSLVAGGVDADLAARLVRLGRLAELFDIAGLAEETGAPLRLTADIHYRIGSIIEADWVRDGLASCAGEDRWERRAAEGLAESLGHARRAITRSILSCQAGGAEVADCVAEYRQAHAAQIAAVRALIGDLRSAPRLTLAGLVVVLREIGRLARAVGSAAAD